jgi:hypothetical protein
MLTGPKEEEEKKMAMPTTWKRPGRLWFCICTFPRSFRSVRGIDEYSLAVRALCLCLLIADFSCQCIFHLRSMLAVSGGAGSHGYFPVPIAIHYFSSKKKHIVFCLMAQNINEGKFKVISYTSETLSH